MLRHDIKPAAVNFSEVTTSTAPVTFRRSRLSGIRQSNRELTETRELVKFRSTARSRQLVRDSCAKITTSVVNITGCANCYNGDVSFLREKLEL